MSCGTGTGPGQRTITLTIGADILSPCYYGPNNLNGYTHDMFIDQGYTLIDKVDSSPDTGGAVDGALNIALGQKSGSFTIDAGILNLFDNIVIAFKVGGGTRDPDWVAFLLDAPFTISTSGLIAGTFDVTPKTGRGAGGGLSHAQIYGMELPPPGPGPSEVPLPGAVALMGTVLASSAGFGHWRRRRRAAAA